MSAKKSPAKTIALLGVMTALLETVKWALSALANVELVSLFCGLFGFVFGPISVVSVVMFVFIEAFLWGFQTWVIAYLVHFPLILLTFALLKRLEVSSVSVYVLIAVLYTFLFGVFTSFLDAFVGLGFEGLVARFLIIYARGIAFFVVHVVCNALTFSFLFKPLAVAMEKIKEGIKL